MSIQINLNGVDGNAYALIGYARAYGKQLGFSREKIESISKDMMSADYNHLLSVFRKNYGHVIDLVKDEVDDE